MKTLDKDLWERIEAFELNDSESLFPFSRRLAQENAWTPEEAERAIFEYKRFAYLAMAAGHPVAPSDEIDQVWHLHLTYSHAYWGKWCREILGAPLHHNPSRGGERESRKFADWYEKTLASYRSLFDEAPPARFWPPVEQRFASHQRYARVNCDRNWIIPKPDLRVSKCVFLWQDALQQKFLFYFQDCWTGALSKPLTASLIFPILLLGCNSALTMNSPLNYKGPDFLAFFCKIWLLSLLLAIFLRWYLRLPDTDRARVTRLRPDPYLVAYVRGRGVLAGNAAIASLVHAKYLEADPNGLLSKTSLAPPTDLHLMQKAVLCSVHASLPSRVSEVRAGIARELENLDFQAENDGLLTAPTFRVLARWVPFAIAFSVPLLGVVKIGVGIARDKPVGYLVILSVIAALVALIGFLRDPYRSRFGSAWLNQIRRRNRSLKSGLGKSAKLDQINQLALAVALFGTPVLATVGLQNLGRAITPPAGSSTSGCGGSCGSSCGGSGGGCGGCGGGD